MTHMVNPAQSGTATNLQETMQERVVLQERPPVNPTQQDTMEPAAPTNPSATVEGPGFFAQMQAVASRAFTSVKNFFANFSCLDSIKAGLAKLPFVGQFFAPAAPNTETPVTTEETPVGGVPATETPVEETLPTTTAEEVESDVEETEEDLLINPTVTEENPSQTA